MIDYFQPKIGYQETFLARTQTEKGHEVLVVTSDRYSPGLFRGGVSKEILGDRIVGAGFRVEEGISVLRLPILMEFEGTVWLRGLERSIVDFRPDAIHVHGLLSTTTIRVLMMRRRLKNARIIMDDHMVNSAMRGRRVLPIYAIFRLFFSGLALANSDALCSVSEESTRFMVKYYGFPIERIKRIPLGCDANSFRRDFQIRSKRRREMGIPEKEVVFCYVGKIIPEKGVDLLIKSGIEAMKAGRDLSVLCAGGRDEEYFGRITELIESSGFKRRFHFLRPVPNKELFNLYSIADVGVWPKQCSLTMIEAMACHLPVIISDGSGATERVTQMTSGLIYHEDDIADLRAKMEEFFDGETLFAFGQNARRYAECHDWTKISTLFESLYRM